MAQKRMFDRAIIETDNFLNISMGAKALYFLLGMEADDEGFVSPNRVLRIYGGEMGDVKNLIDTGLVIPFKSGVLVITHWNENNYLDKNRIKETQYQDEKKMLSLTESKKYVLNNRSTRIEEKSIEENRIEESIVKPFSKEKATYGEFNKVKLSQEEYDKLIERMGEKNTLLLIAELDTYIASKGKKYASHYATILGWARRKVIEITNTKKVHMI
jgi:hypothetical protein